LTRNIVLALAFVATAACSREKKTNLTIPVASVDRQTIVVDAQATGVVEPINVIEVKAKSSGQIVAMPVETGTFVKAGDLLVQLDTRDTRNAYAQAKADLDAALINARVAKTARDRAAELFKERIITSAENEAAEVSYANAQASVLRNRAALDIRAQSLEEATVRAPVSGTVIEKPVSIGQVIASGTGTAGGGTTILKMADLTKVRVRTLVNETDIGKVRAGLPASVTVDAFPDRPFAGTVEKIEPQATIQQAVTMFPVLVSIDNVAGLLMPGMNGEVSIEVERRDNALAVSNDAVRSPNEVVSVATLLGLNPDSVRAVLFAGRGGQGGGPGGGASGDQGSPQGGQAAPGEAGERRAGDSTRDAGNRGGNGGMRRARGGNQQGGNPQAANAQGGNSQGGNPQGGGARAGGQRGQGGFGGGQRGGQGGGGRRGMVFVVDNGKYIPKVVRLGVSNFDVSEVISGLSEGDSVAILNVAAMQARQQEEMDRIRSRGGMPGMQRQQPQGQGGQGGQGGQRGGGGSNR
jgi:HlyD family secretion protein